MSLEVATHKAVHDALVTGSSPSFQATLAALISGRVYDKVPGPPVTYPYLVIDVDIRDDGNTCSNASEAHATIHVWTNTVGSIQAKTIGGLVRKILAPDDPDDDDNLEIEDFVTSAWNFDAAIYRDGGDTLLTEGVLTFTYLVDPE